MNSLVLVGKLSKDAMRKEEGSCIVLSLGIVLSSRACREILGNNKIKIALDFSTTASTFARNDKEVHLELVERSQ